MTLNRGTLTAIAIIITMLLISMVIPYILGVLILIAVISTLIPEDFYIGHIQHVPRKYYDAYREYLQSSEWYILRGIVLRRDAYTCVDCGSKDRLHVHHLHYDGIKTMTFHPSQLVTVCEACHTKRHRRF